MISGTTSSGFEFHVPEGLVEDIRFLKAFVTISKKELSTVDRVDAIFNAVEAVFNDHNEEERFYQYLASKSPTGRTDINTVAAEISEIARICREKDEGIKK